MNRDLLKLASDAMRLLMNGRDFGTGQISHYLNIISRIEDELNRPQFEQEFYPDWDMLKPFYERIKELETALAQPRKEWVGLTDTDLMKEFGYTDELLRDTAYRVEQTLKDKNDTF